MSNNDTGSQNQTEIELKKINASFEVINEMKKLQNLKNGGALRKNGVWT